MKVLQVKEYNRQQEVKWHEACRKHKYNTQADFYTMPQLAFYCYFTNNGNYRQAGYVAFEDNKSTWASTKREAIAQFNA